MVKKCGLTVIIAICLALFGLSGQNDVLACEYLPCVEIDTETPIDVEEGVFEFRYDLYTYNGDIIYDYVAIQVADIECHPNGNRGCTNIQVYLGESESPIVYEKRSKKFLKNSLCEGQDGLTFKPRGPRPSYYLVVPLFIDENEEIKSNDSETIGSIVLRVRIESSIPLTLGDGHTVINKNTCKVCPSKVPVRQFVPLNTTLQCINLKEGCQACVRFNADGDALPLKQKDLKGPKCDAVQITKTYSNDKIKWIVEGLDGEVFTLDEIQPYTTKSVPLTAKTGDNTEIWLYIPGLGWQ